MINFLELLLAASIISGLMWAFVNWRRNQVVSVGDLIRLYEEQITTEATSGADRRGRGFVLLTAPISELAPFCGVKLSKQYRIGFITAKEIDMVCKGLYNEEQMDQVKRILETYDTTSEYTLIAYLPKFPIWTGCLKLPGVAAGDVAESGGAAGYNSSDDDGGRGIGDKASFFGGGSTNKDD